MFFCSLFTCSPILHLLSSILSLTCFHSLLGMCSLAFLCSQSLPFLFFCSFPSQSQSRSPMPLFPCSANPCVFLTPCSFVLPVFCSFVPSFPCSSNPLHFVGLNFYTCVLFFLSLALLIFHTFVLSLALLFSFPSSLLVLFACSLNPLYFYPLTVLFHFPLFT